MSQHTKHNTDKITLPKIQKMAKMGEKISMVTAYDYTMARMVDAAGADMILVGDSLGMVIQGHDSTLPVSIGEMIYHTKCVARGVTRAMIMADMPFMSYQASHEEAVRNAGELLKVGAQGIKIEGGEELGDLIWYLNKVGIPVMAHVGLKPQSIHTMGGYKTQGKNKLDAESIIEDAKILEEAGAFCILMEGIPTEVAQKITESVEVPTIGIGCGPHCHGQVLVCNDILGYSPDFKPKFVKTYAHLYDESVKALSTYVNEVKKGVFPAEEHATHQNLTIVDGGDDNVTPKKSKNFLKKKTDFTQK
ncbi:3-methyl-2-oxobutanoate hydroxymethyltransferase [bacterium]|nr:3-methyl-2-oxobutanoate hydroxymethyltransferase [bacterium]